MALVSSLAKGLRKTPRESLDPIGPPAPTDYAGSYPTTVAALNGWTLASPWTILHNFTSATIGPSACSSATGSETLNLIKLGSDNTATLEAAGQGGYATQGGYTVNTNQDFMYTAPAASWKFSATVPTAYIATIKFDGTPANGQTFLGGSDGTGGGWWLEAHSTSGIRAAVGSGGGYVNTSYVGGASLYDGEYHTIMLVIDDAAGKAKIFTEFGNTESTGLTLASGSAYYTLGPVGAGLTWTAPVTYLLSARGEHPLLYTNAQSLFDEYEDARLNNVNQTAIAGLPTTLAELNDATGLTFTHGWNLGSAASNAPVTGASGATLAPNTGALIYGGTGTAPTLAAAPQVRTSFTSQNAITNDSSKDNMQGSDLWPDSDFTAIIVSKCNWSTNPEIAQFRRSVAGERGWRLLTDGTNVLLYCYSSSPTATSHSIQKPATWGTAYNLISFRVPSAGAQSRICSGYRTPSNSGSNQAALGTASTSNPTIGAESQDAANTTSVAFVGYLSGQVADATMDAAHQAFQWRYGL